MTIRYGKNEINETEKPMYERYDFNGKEYNAKEFLNSFTKNENVEINDILSKNNIQLINDEEFPKRGFSSGVYRCTANGKESIIKFSSLRLLTGDTDAFADIAVPPVSEEQNEKIIKTNIQFDLETYAYNILSDERKATLAVPFKIAVFFEGEICDYIFCMNIPQYIPVRDVLGKKTDNGYVYDYGEKEVLEMVEDVLEQLETALEKSRRHRDIKLENIMYDADEKRYVLIDWGSSHIVYPIKTPGIAHTSGYTPIYVDPACCGAGGRDKLDNVNTDLYPLGVLMAYMLHKDGLKSDKGIEAFWKKMGGKVLPLTGGKEVPVMDYDLYKELETSGVSDGYCEIVKKIMNHESEYGYKHLSEIFEDLKKLRKPQFSQKDNHLPKIKGLNFKSWYGIIPAFVIAVLVWLLFGYDGFSSQIMNEPHMGYSVLALAYCTLFPFIAIAIKTKGTKFEINIAWKNIIIPAAVFVLLNIPTVVVLKKLKISYPLFLAVVHLFCVVLLHMISKGKAKAILCSLVSGMFVGCFVALCVSYHGIGWTPECFKIIFAWIVFGILCGVNVSFCEFLYNTRLKRLDT